VVEKQHMKEEIVKNQPEPVVAVKEVEKKEEVVEE
jgi:hypothetical protein